MDLLRFLRDLNYVGHERPSGDEIKKRWKELCRKHHPDLGGDRKEFDRITHAYQMLTDPDYRQQEIMREMRTGKKSNAKGDLNLRIQVPVSFEDAFFGRKMMVSWNRLEFTADYDPIVKEEMEIHSETFVLPPGSVHGYEYLAHNRGHRCGIDSGHAYLVVVAMPHKKFKVQSHDVISEEEVPLAALLKGGKVEIQTMYGLKTLKIPAGTQPGEQLHINNCGIARQGSHIAVLRPVFPSKDELRRGDAWKGLDIDWGRDNSAPDAEADELLFRFLDERKKGVP